MPSSDFRLLPEAEFQRLTPSEREAYMTRLKLDLDEKIAQRTRQSQKLAEKSASKPPRKPGSQITDA